MMNVLRVILLVAVVAVAFRVLGTAAAGIAVLLVFPTMFVRWLPLKTRAGPLRFDLGRPEKDRYVVPGVLVGLGAVSTILDVAESLAAGRLSDHLVDLALLCVYLVLAVQLALMAARGVSIREAGVLTGDYFVPWKHVTLSICEPGAVRVTMQFHGAGVGGLIRFEPIRDVSVVWPLPPGVDGADVATFLAGRVPPAPGLA
jgi:hypothetical protein